MKTQFKIFTVAIAVIALFSFAFKEIPTGWFIAGSKPDSYSMGMDDAVFKTGAKSATIQSTDKKIKGFGTLMQTMLADEYLGKKIKLSGFVKSEDVNGWAGLWMRIDGNSAGQSLGFDNMKDRAIVGTTDWKQYEIILSVPQNSSTLNFGALLSGTGKLWFDDMNIEVVSDKINSTSKAYSKKPTNLNFED